jgi:hypothetical protein
MNMLFLLLSLPCAGLQSATKPFEPFVWGLELPVRDVAAAALSYADGLGFHVLSSGGEVARLEKDGLTLVLEVAAGATKVGPQRSRPGSVSLTLTSSRGRIAPRQSACLSARPGHGSVLAIELARDWGTIIGRAKSGGKPANSWTHSRVVNA